VHRVGEESEASRQQPSDHFHGRDRDREGEDEGERPSVTSPYGREVAHGLRVLTLMDVRELLKREIDPAEVEAIRELWKQHSIAEDNRDIAGLLATLTDDCVYELAGTSHRWEGHEGATRFYTGLLTAFPDIDFKLTDIVVGPQGVCEEARVTGTHERDWLDFQATGEAVEFGVVIFFPWDPARRLFRGEKVHTFELGDRPAGP
jgi:predicted ester cyclase